MEPNHYNTSYSFKDIDTLQRWREYATRFREQVRRTCDLPFQVIFRPNNTNVLGKREYKHYCVENLVLEVIPGFEVCGNLYYPRQIKIGKRVPAVLSPHGHWPEGRFSLHDDYSVVKRCVYFARLGFVVLTIDMMGYGETALKLGHQLFRDKASQIWGIHLLGLQIYNLKCALDYLQSLDYVDPDRIGCTGGSGGGTQTYLLAVLDDRIKAAAPVNMVSAHMQGSCICENSPNLRIGTNNMEITALIAPRPLLLIGASGDFTRDLPKIEFPAIRKIYQLYGQEDNIEFFYQDCDHNYNQTAWEMVGQWLCKHLQPDNCNTEVKNQCKLPSIDDLKIPANYKLKSPGSENELFREIKKYIYPHAKNPGKTLTGYRDAFAFIFGFNPVNISDQFSTSPGKLEKHRQTPHLEYSSFTIPLEERAVKGELICPAKPADNTGTILYVNNEGIRGLYNHDHLNNHLKPYMRSCLKQNFSVAAADLWNVGDNRHQRGNTEMFTTYNYLDTVLRVQEIAAILTFFLQQSPRVIIVGEGIGGIWALFANALAGNVTLGIYDFRYVNELDDDFFLKYFCVPYIRRYGDIETALCLLYQQEKILVTNGDYLHFPVATRFHREMNTIRHLRYNPTIPAPPFQFLKVKQ